MLAPGPPCAIRGGGQGTIQPHVGNLPSASVWNIPPSWLFMEETTLSLS